MITFTFHDVAFVAISGGTPGVFSPSLNFSYAANSQYLPLF